jgi:hypothetical protein
MHTKYIILTVLKKISAKYTSDKGLLTRIHIALKKKKKKNLSQKQWSCKYFLYIAGEKEVLI